MRISDWSSDVCSSDLFHSAIEAQNDLELLGRGHGQDPTSASPGKATRATIRRRSIAAPSLVKSPFGLPQGTRTARRAASAHSEERRVGKEGVSTCRSRWRTDHYTNQTKINTQL